MGDPLQKALRRGDEKAQQVRRTRTLLAVLAAIILIFVIFTRFAFLSEKPFHHDESQYATFSNYAFEGSPYRYNPVLHGPFLTYSNVVIFKLFGVSDFSARFGPAFFGVLLLVLLFRFSLYMGFAGVIFLCSTYAVSPSFTYYDRFLGMDSYIAFFSVLFIYFFMQHIRLGKPRYIYLASTALACLFLIKVNSYIYAFIFLSFLLILKFTELPPDIEELKAAYQRKLKEQFIHIFLGVCLFFVIFAVFYTSFLTNLQGFFDGLFIKSLGYWMGQNAQQRIKGSFDYYIPIIMIYELPIVLITAIASFRKIFSNAKSYLISVAVTISAILISILLALTWDRTLPGSGYTPKILADDIFHIQHPYHILLMIMYLYIGTYMTYAYLREGRLFHSFISFWLFFSILIYSYAGEKVPWLSLNILMPAIFFCAISIDDLFKGGFFRKRGNYLYPFYIMIFIALAFTIHIQVRACIKSPADPKERIVYVQTSNEMLGVVERIKELSKITGQGTDLQMAIHGSAGWPLNWYLREYPDHFPPKPIYDRDNKVIIMDHKNVADHPDLINLYDYKRVKLREWWVPERPKGGITLKMLLDYYFKRKVWSTTGSYDIGFFTKKNEP